MFSAIYAVFAVCSHCKPPRLPSGLVRCDKGRLLTQVRWREHRDIRD